jgi:hypothetical protein
MKRDEWWKNFALGLELDASGAFIYNGIKLLDEAERLSHPIDVFEILYNLSVGIERLLKVAIVLIEHNDQMTIQEFEESLITHNTQQLLERLNSHRDLKLTGIHREFLGLLSKFYKTHRYGRYSLGSVTNIDAERALFLEFLKKHLDLNTDIYETFGTFSNTDQIRKFVGKTIKRITDAIYSM